MLQMSFNGRTPPYPLESLNVWPENGWEYRKGGERGGKRNEERNKKREGMGS